MADRDRWVVARGRAERDAIGRPVRFPGVVLDVTARKVAEHGARASERRMVATFRQATVGVAPAGADGRLTEVDDRFCRIVGRDPPGVPGLRLSDSVDPDDVAARLDLSRRPPAVGAPYAVESRRPKPGGTRVWVGRSVSEVKNEQGRPTTVLAVVVDISDRMQVEAERQTLLTSERAARTEAERARRMKDELPATLSHEIRTPMNAILGWSQILARPGVGAADVATGVDVIARNARARAEVIEGLLDMSRVVGGKVRLDVRRLGGPDAVRAAVETARPTADAKGVGLGFAIDPLRGVVVNGDVARPQQLLWDLLSNAVELTPKGGQARVLLGRADARLEINVADTGKGIRTESLPFVSDRFRRADASTTRGHGGPGLGLSIVKQSAELHGGSIRVESPGLGGGSTSVVALPFAEFRADPDPDPDPDPTSSAADVTPQTALPDDRAHPCVEVVGVRVLGVDDDADARALVKRILEDCEAVVTAAGSADEAIRAMAGATFDVLVSDVGMPGVDGPALVRRVLALGEAAGGDVPAIALTAFARPEDRLRATAGGFVMRVAKPVEPAELVTTVAGAAGRTGRRVATPRVRRPSRTPGRRPGSGAVRARPL